MMLNPVTLMKCKKIKKELDELDEYAGSMQGGENLHKHYNELVAQSKELGCK